LIYREAFTTSAAEQVIDHLVNACGLRPDRDAVPALGKIVFVYRQARDTGLGKRDTGVGDGDSGKVAVGPPVPRSDQAPLHKLAA